MSTITARILQSFGLNINKSAIASRELGLTADTEQPVIGTTVGGAKYLGTEDYVTIATAAPAAIAIIRRSFVEYLCDTVGAGANIALDIRAGAETLGARLKVYALGATAFKVTVQYATGVFSDVPAGTATEFVWNGSAWAPSQAASATTSDSATLAASATSALYAINFDLVIDSDAKLASWAAGGTYAKVLIKAGTWTLASGGVDLTARGTKLVVGEPGSKLVFSSASASGALYYTAIPTTNDYRLENVIVECSSASFGICFGYCTNLYNCTGTASGINGVGFFECTNLFNCIGSGQGSGTGYGIGIYRCNQVFFCLASGTNPGSGPGYGVSGCVRCQQNRTGTCKTAKYDNSYSGGGQLCADTANGGFNS